MKTIEGNFVAAAGKYAIVVGRWNSFVVESLLEGALDALRRHGVLRPSLMDWKSRAHFSPFDNAKSKQMLGWQPEADRAAFVRKGIKEANLLGY